MAFSLTLPSRPRKVRARMALDDGSPDFTLPKLAAWCATNMSRSELLDFADSLRDLAAKGDAEDDNEPDTLPSPEAVKRERTERATRAFAGSLDSRRGGHINTAKAEAEFLAMFPDAKRLKP
jgi:hypothetical protein